MLSLYYCVVVCSCYINNRSKVLLTRDSGTRDTKHETIHSAFFIPHSALVNRSTNGEVELAVVVACHAIDVIEAIAPVEAKQAEHGQVDSHAQTR